MVIFHGYEITSDWKNSQCGKTAIGAKGGKSFFLKKYQTPVMPINNGALDVKTFAHNKELFDDFVKRRKEINAVIRTLTGPGGNIVVPCDEFIDVNQYVEVSELVDGAVPDDNLEEVLSGIPVEAKLLLMKTAAGALASIHSKGIIHSDLKLKNMLLAKSTRGNYVAKLIDFDSSYFIDNKPEEIIGTLDYYSPELGAYSDNEDDRESLADKITEKTDIFSLGLIFHQYLSGEFPKPVNLVDWLLKMNEKGKAIYCWVALNCGCDLELSPKIKSLKYCSLIRDMLSIRPEDRPTALEVQKRLGEPESVIGEPWPEHRIVLDRDKLKSSNVGGLKRIEASGEKKYELLFCDGRKTVLSKNDMVSECYARIAVPEGFCDPWPEHGIRFDEDKLKIRGFISAERKTIGGVNGYEMYRADSSSNFLKVEMLLMMKCAVKSGSGSAATSSSTSSSAAVSDFRASEIGFADPWPEHGIEFDRDAIRSRGYVASKQEILSGVNGYRFFKSDGSGQFIKMEMAVMLKMARKSL